MWLLDTHELKLHWFTYHHYIDYAILSHRWEDDEVDFTAMREAKTTKDGKGFLKIQSACHRAVEDGYDYIWIDTCCINKDSSAELSESINSMFQWYKSAKVCYAYLFDVNTQPLESNSIDPVDRIKHSEWFKRGWTPQELIAPSQVIFFDKTFRSVCQKTDSADALSTVTGIDRRVLEGGDFRRLSVAKRMSWASERRTTRVEDEAYSLLGLFDVSMPLLYGEGASAFRRLQEEILRSSSDHSILAWSPVGEEPHVKATRSLASPLATSPRAFKDSGDVVSFSFAPKGTLESYAITNVGLRITLPVKEIRGNTFALLNCRSKDKPFQQLAIALVQDISDDNQWWRAHHPLHSFTIRTGRRFTTKSIVIRIGGHKSVNSVSRFWLRSIPSETQGMRLIDIFPPGTGNPKANIWTPDAEQLDDLEWSGWMRFAILGQHELLLNFNNTAVPSTWPTKLRRRGDVRAFTLCGLKYCSTAEVCWRLRTHRAGENVVEGYPGIRVQFKTEIILGEQTCVVDIKMYPQPLFRRLYWMRFHAHSYTAITALPVYTSEKPTTLPQSENDQASLSESDKASRSENSEVESHECN